MQSHIRILLFILLLPIPLMAQKKSDLVDMADNYYIDGDFYTAAIWYKKAMVVDTADLQLVYRFAEANRQYFNYPIAEARYAEVIRRDSKQQFPLAQFWLAVMKKNNGNYIQAKKEFEKYLSQHAQENSFHTKTAANEIKACEIAPQLKRIQMPVTITHLDSAVNSVHTEFGANQLGDTLLLFSSLRPIATIEDIPDGSPIGSYFPGTFLTKIYTSKKQEGTWSKAKEIDIKINNNKTHNANIALMSKGNRLYYTRCHNEPNTGIVCSICMMEQQNGQWQKSTDLPESINTKGFTATHPSVQYINDTTHILYFSSNRDGGYGNNDIWYSVVHGNTFNYPQNAGENINTIGNEISPFYDNRNNTLYFSSDWHIGLGGYDIFSSQGKENKWSAANNIGSPYNTSYNDIYFTVNSNDNNGYITSNRPGSFYEKSTTCCNDIYQYTIIKKDSVAVAEIEKPKPENKPTEPEKVTKTSKVAQAKTTLLSIPTLTLYFANDEPDAKTTLATTSKNYKETFNTYLQVLPDYLANSNDKNALQIFINKELNTTENQIQAFTEQLLQVLQTGKKVTLSIEGYCSPLTANAYNIALSKRRIQSFINWLNIYENGFHPFIKSGNLVIKEIPFGEEKANKKVSDDFNKQAMSVYSAEAAKERRIVVKGEF